MINCAPGAKNTNVTCYSMSLLMSIARSYNKNRCHGKECIKITGKNKKELYNAIKKTMKDCNNDMCWVEQKYIRNSLSKKDIHEASFNTFRPKPDSKKENNWLLSTIDITNVLRQYQKVYPDFKSFGALPNNFNHSQFITKITKPGKYKHFAFVINDDPDTMDGSHWVALYIKLSGKNAWIEYYDSYGQKPLPHVAQFIKKIKNALESEGIKITLKINKHRLQKGNTECGMFAINFIIERLKGKCFECIKKNDKEVQVYRQKYFS